MLAFNHGDGLNLHGWDGFLSDNWFSGNQRAGFGARDVNASITFTGNRVEWNGEENLLITGGDGYQITGNFFDRAGTCGIALRKGHRRCFQMTITGNYFKRSGKRADAASFDSAHILMEGAEGVTCVGNNLHAGRDDGGQGCGAPPTASSARTWRIVLSPTTCCTKAPCGNLLLTRVATAKAWC